jgi:hypothetical protein
VPGVIALSLALAAIAAFDVPTVRRIRYKRVRLVLLASGPNSSESNPLTSVANGTPDI